METGSGITRASPMKPNHGYGKRVKYLGIGILALVLLFSAAVCRNRGEQTTLTGIVEQNPVANSKKEQVEKRSLLANTSKDEVIVYFTAQEGNYLVPVTLPINPTRDLARIAVEKLLAGPADEFLQWTIPEETKLREMHMLGRTAYLDLTSDMESIQSQEEALRAIESLVFTITDLPEVDSVFITIDGKAVKELAGVDTSRPLTRPETINYLREQQKGKSKAKIYFADSNALYLIPVTVELKAEPADLLGKARGVMEALIKGPPQASGLNRTIWPGTRLLGIQIAGEQVEIDLSSNVIGYGGGSTMEYLLINSLLFTLTDLPGINKIQLLIEGKKQDYLPEGTPIVNPLPRPQRLNWYDR
ncbi:MAG: GerMN domain-containing protein [Bacillota bacterium]